MYYKLLLSVSMLILINGISSCVTREHNIKPEILLKQTNSYSDIVATVSQKNTKYLPKNVLIVLDIDNTILTSSIDLGGDVWYQWQRNKLDIKPEESQKVNCLFEDAIGLLYELGPMNLTEPDLPEIIEKWQTNGNTLMALTSRAPNSRAATERELLNKKIDFTLTALAAAGKGAPVYREMLARELSYMKGIMMTSGMNKGKMLKYILNKTKRSFDAIIFVDDSHKNIDSMFAEFSKNKDIDMTIFHYTKIEESRIQESGLVLTSEQAFKMDNDWKKLNSTLHEIFPGRNLKDRCLSLN